MFAMAVSRVATATRDEDRGDGPAPAFGGQTIVRRWSVRPNVNLSTLQGVLRTGVRDRLGPRIAGNILINDGGTIAPPASVSAGQP